MKMEVSNCIISDRPSHYVLQGQLGSRGGSIIKGRKP